MAIKDFKRRTVLEERKKIVGQKRLLLNEPQT